MGEVIIAIFIGACMAVCGVIMRVKLAKEMKANAEKLTE